MAYFEQSQQAPERVESYSRPKVDERKQLVDMSDPDARSLFNQSKSQVATDADGQMNFGSPYAPESIMPVSNSANPGDSSSAAAQQGSSDRNSLTSEVQQLLQIDQNQSQEIEQLINLVDQYLGGQGTGDTGSSGAGDSGSAATDSGATGSGSSETGSNPGGDNSGTSNSSGDSGSGDTSGSNPGGDGNGGGGTQSAGHHRHGGSNGHGHCGGGDGAVGSGNGSGSDNTGSTGSTGIGTGSGSDTTGGAGSGSGSDSTGSTGTGSGNAGTGSDTTGSTGTGSSSGGDTTGSSSSSGSSTGLGTVNSGDVLSSNSTVAAMEQNDPSLENALNAASSTMSSQGYASLESYLATNNATANPNFDATVMGNAMTQAGLSSTDTSALQSALIGNMQQSMVLTYAQKNDPTLYKTLTDASQAMSSSGYAAMENYLVNNYTATNDMDGNLMSNVLTQAGLSAADQNSLAGVLQTDMPTALTADPFLAGMQSTDQTMAQTLGDASSTMSQAGYQQLESFVENNYTGQTSMDPTIMNEALSQAGLSSSDVSALTGVLQNDLPSALASSSNSGTGDSTGTGDTTGSAGTGDSTGTTGTGDTTGSTGTGDSTGSTGTGDTTGSTGTGDSTGSTGTGDTTGSTGTGDSTGSTGTGDTTGSTGTGDSTGNTGTGDTTGSTGTGDSTGSTGTGDTTGSTGNDGQPSSTNTFTVGGETLLAPPSSTSGLVTPTGSESGDDTAYQGPIQGYISGNNNVTDDSMIDGQGNGPDALQMTGGASVITSMDDQNGTGFTQKYGYFEADIKVEGTPNGWPGWYLESSAHTLNPNGAVSSEIDIMEAQTSNTNGDGQTSYFAGVHRNSSDYGNGTVPDSDQGPYTQDLPNITSGYNNYGVLWQPNDKNIEFYFDGKEVGYNPVYDSTDSSPMEMILDNGNGGWTSSDPSYSGGTMDVAYVRAYQEQSLLNSANDPGGTEGTTITDTNPDDSPPALSGVTWINTFNSDFTQASDYTANSGYTSSNVLNSQNMSEEYGEGSGLTPDPSKDPDNTPWHMGEWMYDQQTSETGAAAGMSTTPGANG